MGFLKRLAAAVFGLGKAESHNEAKDEDDDSANNVNNNSNNNSDDNRRNRAGVDPGPIPGPRKGFSVPAQIPVERPVGPILLPCNGDGGVQGLRWYASRLRMDEDGDVADEFLCEVFPDTSAVMQDEQKPFPRFQVNRTVKQALVRNQAMSSDGRIQQCVEWQGRYLLV